MNGIYLYIPQELQLKQDIIRRTGGALELHVPVADTRDIESWILSLGEHAKVLRPKSLGQMFKSRHRLAISGK